ncbi:hypothetical protein ABIE21_001081 [Conyzicola nivalis]|uniref:Competence protein CoiA nuclease-like domain-containing protein n=1 Tax=Conyzicola nivalis TaxID=1477021 RepID=A0ABV2QKM0_9MICO
MHTAEELERFQQGETRHLFAAYRDGRPGLYYLEQGSAHSVREYAKANLRCAIASCAAPELTTVGRATRRDGFRHLNDPRLKHGLESDFHIAAKGVIERWAAGQDTTMSARLEQDPDGTRQRRADVLVTWRDESKVAFEPQYSGISLLGWQRRHDWYVDRGIPDVWLFGHGGRQLRTSGAGGLVKLSQVQLAVARTAPVLWINPDQELIATIDVKGSKPWNGREPLRGRLLIIPVDECVLTRRGLEHPAISRCHAEVLAMINEAERRAASHFASPDDFGWTEAAVSSRRDRTVSQQQAWDTGTRVQKGIRVGRSLRGIVAADEGSQPDRPLTSRELAFLWASTAQARAVAGEAGQKWMGSPQGRAVIAKLGPNIASKVFPPVLPLPTNQWQMFVFDRFVLRCPPGAKINLDSAAAEVQRHFAGQELPDTCDLDAALVADAVSEWFQHAAGVLVRRLGPRAFTRGE